jgi:FKBP-type peptidyl-prolyl cis-trans isomerase SlyD
VTEDNLTVTDGLVVSLDYTLRLDDGEIIDSSVDREPLEFLQGQGQIVSGLEQELYGMAVDDQKDVEVSPADGYGERDADAIELVARDVFPPELDVRPGIGLRMRDGSGQAMDAYVADVRPDGVLLDFNHPLAGETLFFQIKIAALRPATSDELAHGHIHDAEDGH